jgi:hypothetical protein
MTTQLTAEQIREIVSYDPETGEMRWRKSRGSRAQAGGIVGAYDAYGYRNVGINGLDYKVHRLAWLYVHGEWPNGSIDHINGHKADNRLSNLRVVTQSQNLRNTRRHKDGRSGFKGVHWHKQTSTWIAQIMCSGKKRYLGQFTTPEAAHAAYCAAAVELSGEFARFA